MEKFLTLFQDLKLTLKIENVPFYYKKLAIFQPYFKTHFIREFFPSLYFKESAPYFKQLALFLRKKPQRSVIGLNFTFYDPESFVNW